LYFCDRKNSLDDITGPAIGLEVEILFLRGGEAAAQKKIAAESPTPRLPTPGQGLPK